MLYGDRNTTVGAPRRNLVAPDRHGRVDRDAVNDNNFFNPHYRNMTISEMLQSFDARGGPAIGVSDAQSDPDALTFSKLRDAQKGIVAAHRQPEHKHFGRVITWICESVGNVGKSVLCKYLTLEEDAILVGGTTRDALHAIAQYCAKHGRGPKLVLFDIPRGGVESVNYELIELTKNGHFLSE